MAFVKIPGLPPTNNEIERALRWMGCDFSKNQSLKLRSSTEKRMAKKQEMPMERPQLQSQITFLYYHDLKTATRFYEEVLKLVLCHDQSSAKIYRVAAQAFVGIVDESKGHCRAQDSNAVLITLVVTDVEHWYDYLKKCGVKLLTEVQQPQEFPVKCFFFEDPGGYQFEVQSFLKPETARRFI